MASTRKGAEDILGEQLVEATRALPLSAHDRDMTFTEYAERWREGVACDLESKTQRSYAQLLKLHLEPTLGSLKLREIRRSHVRTLLRDKQNQGLSPNTVRLIKATLSTVLGAATDDEIIFSNVALQLGRRKKAGRVQSYNPGRSFEPMTGAQLQQFLEGLDRLETERRLESAYVVLFHLMAKTGLRPSEALALQLSDVDRTTGRLKVERALSSGRIKSTKTGKTRTVDLSPLLHKKLDGYLTLREAEAVANGQGTFLWLFTNTIPIIPMRAIPMNHHHLSGAWCRDWSAWYGGIRVVWHQLGTKTSVAIRTDPDKEF